MGSAEEYEEIIELVDVLEEGPELTGLYEKSLKELEESSKETDPFSEPEGLEKLYIFAEKTKEYSEEKFSIGETDFTKEPELQDEWEIEWASNKDSTPHKGQVEGVYHPELSDKEIQTSETQEVTPEDQEIKKVGELESKTVEGIIREVSREVIEAVAMKIAPDITEGLIKAVNEKIERIAIELFPPIAEKVIKEEIEKLKEEGD